MGLDLTGPADETAIQCIERLTALKQSLRYDSMGSYKGGPNDRGCDEDDMNDLNADLACAAMEALPRILGMRSALEEIAKGRGPFRRDPLEFATACLEHAVETAKAALEGREAVTA